MYRLVRTDFYAKSQMSLSLSLVTRRYHEPEKQLVRKHFRNDRFEWRYYEIKEFYILVCLLFSVYNAEPCLGKFHN
jgi:hypothetical protein